MIFCLLLTAAFFYRDSLAEIFRGIRQAKPAAVLVSVLLSMAAYFVEGMIIACMAGAVIPSGFYGGHFRQSGSFHENAGQSGEHPGPVSVRQGVRITFICEFYRMITLGNGSGFAEIHYLHKSGMEAGSAAVLTMIQYMVKRTAVMLLGILGFAVLWGDGDTRTVCREYALFMAAGCAVTAGVIVVFTALALSTRIASWVGQLLNLLPRKLPSWEKRSSKWKEQIRLLNQSGKDFLKQKRRILCTLMLQIMKLLFFYSIPASLLFGRIGISFAETALLMAAAYMLSGIIPAPSGAGALEFVFLLFFSCFTDPGGALSVILIFRFATWVLPFGVGAGLMVLDRKKECIPEKSVTVQGLTDREQ